MKPYTKLVGIIGAAVCAALLSNVPIATASVIDPDLQAVIDTLRPQEGVDVIVRFAGHTDLARFKGVSPELRRSGIVRELKARSEASLSSVWPLLSDPSVSRRTVLWAVNGLALTASADVIRGLARDPAVARISHDAVFRAPSPVKSAVAAGEWNLDAIRSPELWAAGNTGSGVVIGSLDTGVDVTHPDLAPRYRGGANSWFDPFGEHTTGPYDRTGHGTRAMGVMVGGDLGGSSIGVAPDAQWIAARIFDDASQSSLSAIHEAYQWMLDPDDDPDTDDGADIVNNSWSLGNIGGCSLEFDQDLQVLKAAQVAVVFAGGNYGPNPGTSVSPANTPLGFGVGFINESDVVHFTSSRGPSACDGGIYPNVVAPGVNIRTTDLGLLYAWVNGASIAAPHVSGSIALLRSAHPDATVRELEQALVSSAVDLGPAGPDSTYGFGRIDVVVAEEVLTHLTAGGIVAETTYTDESVFLADISGLTRVIEGFENTAPWGSARSPDSLPSATSQGIVWTSNHAANDLSTSGGAARSGSWGMFSDPHGDQNVPIPTDFVYDGVVGSSTEPMVAVGAWFRGTAGGNLVVILDGDESNPIGLGQVTAIHQFYGVVADNGFTQFEFREIEGTLEDQKLIFLDDVTIALGGGGTTPTMDGVVAGAANLPGAFGSDWHTDLYLHNVSAGEISVELYFSPEDGTIGSPGLVAIVAPGETRALEDVVANVFGVQGSGAISWRVAAGDGNGLLVNANTYNRVDAVRRYGQQIPGVPWADAVAAGGRVLVPALAGRYRSNLGFATDGDCSAVVVRGYDRDGAAVAEQTIAVQPWSWMQLNSLFRRVFQGLISDPDTVAVADSLHRFEVSGADGRVIAYMSIIDNATSDGSYMIGQTPDGVGDRWLPGAAVIRGANASDWRADVVMMGTSGTAVTADVSFFPAGQDNSGPPDFRSVPLLAGASSFEGNILAELFGYSPPAVGSLAVDTSAEAPLLWMRTYTEEPAPSGGGTVTYGQAILPRGPDAVIAPGGEGRIVGFSQDATTRANLIFQNTRTAADGSRLASEVFVELLAQDGVVLADRTYSLQPGEYLQHNRFVDDYGTGPVENASLRVTVVGQPGAGEAGGVDAMVSEVNGNTVQGTNDSRLIRAEFAP